MGRILGCGGSGFGGGGLGCAVGAQLCAVDKELKLRGGRRIVGGGSAVRLGDGALQDAAGALDEFIDALGEASFEEGGHGVGFVLESGAFGGQFGLDGAPDGGCAGSEVVQASGELCFAHLQG